MSAPWEPLPDVQLNVDLLDVRLVTVRDNPERGSSCDPAGLEEVRFGMKRPGVEWMLVALLRTERYRQRNGQFNNAVYGLVSFT
jgi:hypothetical protein